jgi:DNA-directed RNA polymerase subunit RPC12/RpoP
MAKNRIQFQLWLSLTQFLEQYGTEERCEQALEQARWPNGFRCENCASTIGLKGQKGVFQLFISTTYRGARCMPCTTMHNDAQLIPAKFP